MMTFANALTNILPYCLAHPGENVLITSDQLTRMGETQTTIVRWAYDNGLTLEVRADGWQLRHEAPALPRPPAPGTPLEDLHPGNRFRLMLGQPMLVQEEVEKL
jgi:hypothetical protein